MLDSLFITVAGLKAWDFIKNRLQRSCFLVNFAKFLRTPYLQNTSRRLLLLISPFQPSWHLLAHSQQ